MISSWNLEGKKRNELQAARTVVDETTVILNIIFVIELQEKA